MAVRRERMSKLPRKELPDWLSNAKWSPLEPFTYIHINKTNGLCGYIYIFVNTYAYMCDNYKEKEVVMWYHYMLIKIYLFIYLYLEPGYP